MTFWKTHSRNTVFTADFKRICIKFYKEFYRDCTADYHFQVDVFPAKLSKMLL